jgi:magnesium-transporting ATPase (P-type)
LNGAVSIYQDYDAEKAIEALKDLQSINALVLRDGTWASIPSRDVVPGDIVQVIFLFILTTPRSNKETKSQPISG